MTDQGKSDNSLIEFFLGHGGLPAKASDHLDRIRRALIVLERAEVLAESNRRRLSTGDIPAATRWTLQAASALLDQLLAAEDEP